MQLLAPKIIKHASGDALDLSKWNIFYADERIVPLSHADSNANHCNKVLFDKVFAIDILKSNKCLALYHTFTQIPGIKPKLHTVQTHLSAADAASAYQTALLDAVGPDGVLDMILLGMGGDGRNLIDRHLITYVHLIIASYECVFMFTSGHTASLFPSFPVETDPEVLVGFVENSPKPPPQRVTLTYQAIYRAREVRASSLDLYCLLQHKSLHVHAGPRRNRGGIQG